MILVEENKATEFRADYMIAISYPLLDLGSFMGIMTEPGAVVTARTIHFHSEH